MAIFINATEDDRKTNPPYPGGALWWDFEGTVDRLRSRLPRPPKPRTLRDEATRTVTTLGDLTVEEL